MDILAPPVWRRYFGAWTLGREAALACIPFGGGSEINIYLIFAIFLLFWIYGNYLYGHKFIVYKYSAKLFYLHLGTPFDV